MTTHKSLGFYSSSSRTNLDVFYWSEGPNFDGLLHLTSDDDKTRERVTSNLNVEDVKELITFLEEFVNENQ